MQHSRHQVRGFRRWIGGHCQPMPDWARVAQFLSFASGSAGDAAGHGLLEECVIILLSALTVSFLGASGTLMRASTPMIGAHVML